MTPELLASSFSVTVPVRTFLEIEARDKAMLRGGKSLCQILGALPGVRDVEYNGHYGPAIYYSLDVEHLPHGQSAVLAAIKDYATAARTDITETRTK